MSELEINVKDILAQQKQSAQMLLRRDIALTKANEKLQALDKEKSEFVSIAAHQLRTPLSAIRWAQQMLLDGDVGELTNEQQQLLNQSQESIRRMIALVHDLLSVDHLEYGQVIYEKNTVNICKVVHDVVEEFRAMAMEKKITYSFVCDEGSIQVYIDTEKVKEALANILNNALKYTLQSGSVTVKVSEKEELVVIECTDTGIGVPEADRHRLFKKFSRADNAKKVDADGSGLGLFIVKKIIEAHNGTITYKSIVGVGSTFTVSLPINTV